MNILLIFSLVMILLKNKHKSFKRYFGIQTISHKNNCLTKRELAAFIKSLRPYTIHISTILIIIYHIIRA